MGERGRYRFRVGPTPHASTSTCLRRASITTITVHDLIQTSPSGCRMAPSSRPVRQRLRHALGQPLVRTTGRVHVEMGFEVPGPSDAASWKLRRALPVQAHAAVIAVRRPGARTISAVCGLGLSALAGLWWIATDRAAPRGRAASATLDTTRADRLSPYGFMNVSLPHLERLAREGVLFDQATSVAPLTLPAHTSLFTGLASPPSRPRQCGCPAADAATTMAEILAARGFRTADLSVRWSWAPIAGSSRDSRCTGDRESRPSQPRNPPAASGRRDERRDGWLDTIGGSRFFLWTHLYDAHRPYDPPEPYRSTYGHNLYVGEIAFADSQIGRLLEALEQRQLLDRTIVMVTADHGESLGEHGERDHGIFVYESVLRVPLVIRAPGLGADA